MVVFWKEIEFIYNFVRNRESQISMLSMQKMWFKLLLKIVTSFEHFLNFLKDVSVSLAAFELTSNWFRKWFSGKWGCLVVTSNSVKLKSISSWPNLRAKRTEMIFHFYFHFKWLPTLENRRERERERENRSRHHRPSTSPAGAVEREKGRKKESIATSPASAVAPIMIAIAIDASIFARCVDLHAIAITIDASRKAPIAIAISPSFVLIWWLFSGFCLCFEE